MTSPYRWRPDPRDPRFTVQGAMVDEHGSIQVSEYEDFRTWFNGEPEPDDHPDPDRPGTRPGEEIPRGIRSWDDVRSGCNNKKGGGWISVRALKGPGKDKWFSKSKTGSWRLSFLLSRLQREVWVHRGLLESAPTRQARAKASAISGSSQPKVIKRPATAAVTSLPPQKMQTPSSRSSEITAKANLMMVRGWLAAQGAENIVLKRPSLSSLIQPREKRTPSSHRHSGQLELLRIDDDPSPSEQASSQQGSPQPASSPMEEMVQPSQPPAIGSAFDEVANCGHTADGENVRVAPECDAGATDIAPASIYGSDDEDSGGAPEAQAGTDPGACAPAGGADEMVLSSDSESSEGVLDVVVKKIAKIKQRPAARLRK